MNQKLLLTTLLSLILSGCATVDALINTEESAYKIIKQDGDFEIREYPSIIVAETFVSGPLAEATNNGFRAIAGYIFGANIAKKPVKNAASNETANETANEKIAMTVPVTVEAENEKIAMTVPVTVEANSADADANVNTNKRWRVHFVMPSKYTLASLPTPKNPAVTLRQIPPQRLATIRFSGFSEEPKVQEQTALLNAWLAKNNVKAIGAPQLARYNPPITLPPLRRNEVMRVVE